MHFPASGQILEMLLAEAEHELQLISPVLPT